MFKTIMLAAVAALCAVAQTQIDLRSQAKQVDFRAAKATMPIQTGTALPESCTVGQLFFKTDAPKGANLYACATADTWSVQAANEIEASRLTVSKALSELDAYYSAGIGGNVQVGGGAVNSPELQITSDSGDYGYPTIGMTTYNGESQYGYPWVYFMTSRGTAAAPKPIGNGQWLGSTVWGGQAESGYRNGAEVRVLTTDDWATVCTADMGAWCDKTKMEFYTRGSDGRPTLSLNDDHSATVTGDLTVGGRLHFSGGDPADIAFTQAREGATVRTLDEKLKDVLSVTDFGADPTGYRDSTAAINAAIAAAGASGTVQFPSGAYRTTNTINISAGITVQGYATVNYDGDGTALKIAASPTSLLNGVNVRDLKIHTASVAATGIYVQNCFRCLIESVYVENNADGMAQTGYGIQVDGAGMFSSAVVIRNSRTNKWKNGIAFTDGIADQAVNTSGVYNCVIDGNQPNVSGSRGIWLKRAHGTTLSGNVIEAYDYGVSITDGAANTTLTANHLESIGTANVFTDTTTYGEVFLGNQYEEPSKMISVNENSPIRLDGLQINRAEEPIRLMSGDLYVAKASNGFRNILIGNADNTYTGGLRFQAGAGSASFGAGLILNGHAHATRPGWFTAALSANAGGKFAVNNSGQGGGDDVFTVDASGNVSASGAATASLLEAAGAVTDAPLLKIHSLGQNYGTGILFATENPTATYRNWAIEFNRNVGGDMVFRQGTSAGADPFTQGTDRLSFTTAGAVFSDQITAAGLTLNRGTGGPHQVLQQSTTNAAITVGQLEAADILGLATSATTDTTDAANITKGVLPAQRIPPPSYTTLGGVRAQAQTAKQFLTAIDQDGTVAQAQPGFGDIAGTLDLSGPQVTNSVWNASKVNPVSTAANTTGEQNLMAISIPAGQMNGVGKTLHAYAAFKHSTGSSANGTLTYRAKLCAALGCTSGTVIPLATWVSGTTAPSSPNAGDELEFWAVTSTPGSSGAIETHGSAKVTLQATTSGSPALYLDANTTPSDAVDLAASYFLQITVACSANGSDPASQTLVTQRMLYAEVR